MPLTEYDPTEIVPVMRQHIQDVLAALSWSYTYFSALDLADGSRQGVQSPTPSKVTRQIAKAYNTMEGYVTDEQLPTD